MMAKVRLAPAFVGSLDLGRDPELGEGVPHRALMWLLARVSAHVHHQHVLGFEGPQLPGAAPPMAHELLPLSMDAVRSFVWAAKEPLKEPCCCPRFPLTELSLLEPLAVCNPPAPKPSSRTLGT